MNHIERIRKCILESGAPLNGDPWELADRTIERWKEVFPGMTHPDEDEVFAVAINMPQGGSVMTRPSLVRPS